MAKAKQESQLLISNMRGAGRKLSNGQDLKNEYIILLKNTVKMTDGSVANPLARDH